MKYFGCLMALVILLSACGGGRVPVMPEATRAAPTGRAIAVLPTATPSGTPLPSTTPTVRPATGTPSPTRAPSVTPTVAFPYQITPDVYSYETSTPVATTDRSFAQYSLKPWTEQDALELIRTMDAYATANHVIVPFYSRYEFIRAQLPVRLAALEFLARYKNSPYEKDVRWRLAFADAWLTNPGSDEWVIQQVEESFNRGEIREDNLETALGPYGFEITSLVAEPEAPNFQCWRGSQPLTVSSLPGLGNARILIIHAIEQDNGLVAALTKDKNEQYTLALIRNGVFRWGHGVCQAAAAQDLTGDGIPEIVVAEGAASGTFYIGTVYFYQWRQDRFVEITGGGIDTTNWETSYSMEILAEPDGSRSIRVHFVQGPLNNGEDDIWKWDGERFSLARPQIVFPLDGEDISNGAIEAALANGQYAAVENQLRGMQNAADGENDPGSALKDYMTFELAVSQALMFQADAARGTLQTLINTPHSPELTALPNAARRFLGVYREETDLYRACLAARSYYESIPSEIKDAAGNKVHNPAIPFGKYARLDLCYPQTMLAALIDKAAPTLSQYPPADLQRYGVQFLFLKKLDINEDGKADWLLMPSIPSENFHRIWFFLNTGAGYQIASAPAGSGSAVRVERLRFSGDNYPTVLLIGGDRLQLYRYRIVGNSLKVERVLDIEPIKSYTVFPINDGFALEITRNPERADIFFPLRRIFTWDRAQGQFVLQDYYEQTLLISGQREKATEAIVNAMNRLVPGIKSTYYQNYEMARFRYLLGLSYELSGDVEKAASMYYELWRSQPDQPYAIMARDKLRSENP